jgi:hypothetical protein
MFMPQEAQESSMIFGNSEVMKHLLDVDSYGKCFFTEAEKDTK